MGTRRESSRGIHARVCRYFYPAPFKRTAVPGYRDGYSGTTWPGYVPPYGRVVATVQEMNTREQVLGPRGRSCGQWDAWEAVFSPACEDGFPCRLWDKRTGAINTTVAAHWRRHWDLADRLARNATLLDLVRHRLHVYVGAADSYYLSGAVIDARDTVEAAATAYLGEPSGVECKG